MLALTPPSPPEEGDTTTAMVIKFDSFGGFT